MKTIILTILLLFAAGGTDAQHSLFETLLFENNKHELTPASLGKLDKLMGRIKEGRKFQISLSGFTDNRFTVDYNLRLSERRVDATKNYFLNKGVKQQQIIGLHFGQDQAVASNDNEIGRQKNRRVEIRIDLYPELRSQSFNITTKHDTTLIGAKGTMIRIQSASFVFEDGSEPTQDIVFNMKEVYGYSDMVLENLTTMSDGQMLETGGMVYLEAWSDNKKLKLKQNARLMLYFPFKQDVDDMLLFEGEHTAQDLINWKADSSSRAMFNSKHKKSKMYFEDDAFYYPPFKYKTVDFKLPFYVRFMMNLHLINRSNYMAALEYKEEEKQRIPYNEAYDKALSKWKSEEPIRRKLWLNQQKNYMNFNKKLMGMSDEMVRNIDMSTVEQHILSTKSLGWLNCDRFAKIPEDQKISYIIKVPDVNTNIKLVLKKYKSCLSGSRDGENIVFSSLPKNEAVTIIGMVQDKDQPLLDMVEDRTDGKEVKTIQCKPVTYGELTQKLKTLDI